MFSSHIFVCLPRFSHTLPCNTTVLPGICTCMWYISTLCHVQYIMQRGSYEKLEHLGDAILQFLTSDHLYHKFPTLHEGHLSVSMILHNSGYTYWKCHDCCRSYGQRLCKTNNLPNSVSSLVLTSTFGLRLYIQHFIVVVVCMILTLHVLVSDWCSRGEDPG